MIAEKVLLEGLDFFSEHVIIVGVGSIVLRSTGGKFMPKLSKRLTDQVRFAWFCKEYKLDPKDVAQLIALAHRAYSAGERATGDGSPKARRAEKTTSARFEEKAKELGFSVSWSGLWPTVSCGSFDVHLPA